MVFADGFPPRSIDCGMHRIADAQRALCDMAHMQNNAVVFLCVIDANRGIWRLQLAAVADLTAALAVERGAIQNHRELQAL